MWQYNHTDELYHYGVPGMKWGVRRSNYAKRVVRGHAGPSIHLSRKKQLAADKRDLEGLKRGEHLSIGFTKKRQAAYDRRDKANLERRIAKNETYLRNKAAKKRAKEASISEDSRNASVIRKKKIKSMSNQELKDVNKRLELETKYRELSNKSNAGKRAVKAVIATGVAITGIKTTYTVSKELFDKAATKIGSRTIK